MGYSLVDQSSLDNPLGTLSLSFNQTKVSKDPFLRSMTHWFLKDYKNALNTLFDIDIGGGLKESFSSLNELSNSSGSLLHFSSSSSSNGNRKDSMIPHVFNFYTFLKHHPLVLKFQSINQRNETENGAVTPIERRLHFIAGYYHLINGCPLLTLDVLSKLPKYIENKESKKEESVDLVDSTSLFFG